MNSNIYPRNYFNPFEDFSTPEEIPAEIQADEEAEKIIQKVINQISKECQEIFKRNDSRFILDKFRIMIQLEISELIFENHKLKENK